MFVSLLFNIGYDGRTFKEGFMLLLTHYSSLFRFHIMVMKKSDFSIYSKLRFCLLLEPKKLENSYRV